jgi:hypothetical protein
MHTGKEEGTRGAREAGRLPIAALALLIARRCQRPAGSGDRKPSACPEEMQLTELLQAAQSPDATVRNQAEQALNTLQATQYAELCAGLSAELADASKPVDARRLAGLILKNMLDAKEEARKVGPLAQAKALDHMLCVCQRP